MRSVSTNLVSIWEVPVTAQERKGNLHCYPSSTRRCLHQQLWLPQTWQAAHNVRLVLARWDLLCARALPAHYSSELSLSWGLVGMRRSKSQPQKTGFPPSPQQNSERQGQVPMGQVGLLSAADPLKCSFLYGLFGVLHGFHSSIVPWYSFLFHCKF